VGGQEKDYGRAQKKKKTLTTEEKAAPGLGSTTGRKSKSGRRRTFWTKGRARGEQAVVPLSNRQLGGSTAYEIDRRKLPGENPGHQGGLPVNPLVERLKTVDQGKALRPALASLDYNGRGKCQGSLRTPEKSKRKLPQT